LLRIFNLATGISVLGVNIFLRTYHQPRQILSLGEFIFFYKHDIRPGELIFQSALNRLICVYPRPKKSVESVKICVIRVTIPHFILHRAIGTITTPHSYAKKSALIRLICVYLRPV
jgi:hypothetical protein